MIFEAMLFASNMRFFGYSKVQVVRVFLISMHRTRKCWKINSKHKWFDFLSKKDLPQLQMQNLSIKRKSWHNICVMYKSVIIQATDDIFLTSCHKVKIFRIWNTLPVDKVYF